MENADDGVVIQIAPEDEFSDAVFRLAFAIEDPCSNETLLLARSAIECLRRVPEGKREGLRDLLILIARQDPTNATHAALLLRQLLPGCA